MSFLLHVFLYYDFTLKYNVHSRYQCQTHDKLSASYKHTILRFIFIIFLVLNVMIYSYDFYCFYRHFCYYCSLFNVLTSLYEIFQTGSFSILLPNNIHPINIHIYNLFLWFSSFLLPSLLALFLSSFHVTLNICAYFRHITYFYDLFLSFSRFHHHS